MNKTFLPLIKLMKNSNKKDLGIILENLDLKTIENICILIHNLEYSSSHLSKKNQNQLKNHMLKHKKTCKFLANPNNNIYKKRQIVKKQIGNGLLTGLLAIGIPLLTSLFAGKK